MAESNADNKIIILNESCCSDNEVFFCKLRHPRSGEGSYFAFSNDKRLVHELLRFKEKHRCWFDENDVYADGSFLMMTPMDPVFLILPYFQINCKTGNFMLLEQLIHDEEYPSCELLANCVGTDNLSQVCDTKDVGDQKAYRLSSEKLLQYLSRKVSRTIEVLQRKKITMSSGSHVTSFVKSTAVTPASVDDYRKYACGLVCDYLSASVAQDLKQHFGITDSPRKRASEKENESDAKKIKTDFVTKPAEDYSNLQIADKGKIKGGKISSAQKQLNKVDKSNMKSINSFFKTK